MISPFEGIPEGRVVLPLEFQALEELVEGRPTEVEAEQAPADTERRMIDELAANEARAAAHASEVEERVEAARREAWTEGREALGRECEERVALERASVIKVCEQFARERTKYFADAEAEVVRLALSIAARVLHREAELDPLLLRGAVKVALEKVRDESSVVLRVAEDQVEDWKKIVAGGQVEVIVLGDGQMAPTDCVLETSVGKVELGVKAQLKEIERGFFDLLEQRPA